MKLTSRDRKLYVALHSYNNFLNNKNKNKIYYEVNTIICKSNFANTFTRKFFVSATCNNFPITLAAMAQCKVVVIGRYYNLSQLLRVRRPSLQ